MELTERRIPKWKEREERVKNQSFDDSLLALGANGKFINAYKITQPIKSPTKRLEKEAFCEV